MSRYICERLSFAQLYGYTDQGRRERARSVRGPALELESSRGNMTYNFNFRAYPSTEGKRHQGYVRFFKPSNPNTPLDRLACMVDCTCFAGDTLVLMSDGTQKPISQIRPGDSVYTHKGRVRKVLGNVERNLKPGEKVFKLKVNNFPLEAVVTGSHRYYIVKANSLELVPVVAFSGTETLHTPACGSIHSTALIGKESSENRIVKLESSDYSGTVWDLCVDEDHSFIANGQAVANCKDYRYRWAWANKQHGSSQVGPMSLNKAHNRAPRVTNPSARPAICKHLSRVRDYITNQMYGGQGKTIDKLDRLVTLTRKPVVLGGKPVAQSKTPSTNLPPAKPANPWTTASNPNNESVVNVMHTRNLPNLAKLFEDDEKVSDSGLVYAGEDPNAAGGDKLDKLMALVKQVSDNVEKLVGTGAGGTTAEDELDEVPVEGAIELDLTTGEPKPGEDDDKLKLGPTKDQEAEGCPPCNREDPVVPAAPEPEFEPEPELDDAGEDGEARAELDDDAEALDDAALDDEAAALDLDKLAAGEGADEDDEDEDEDEAPRRRGRNPDSA